MANTYDPLGLAPIQSLQAQQQDPNGNIPPGLLKQLLGLAGPQQNADFTGQLAAQSAKNTPSAAAAGAGPGGIRTGVGPNGWMVSLGDALGAGSQILTNKLAQNKHQAALANLNKQAGPTMEQLLDFANGNVQFPYQPSQPQTRKQAQPVPQGTPLTTDKANITGDAGDYPMSL